MKPLILLDAHDFGRMTGGGDLKKHRAKSKCYVQNGHFSEDVSNGKM